MYVRGTDAPLLPIIMLDAPHERPVGPGFMYVRGADAPHLPIILLDVRGTDAPHLPIIVVDVRSTDAPQLSPTNIKVITALKEIATRVTPLEPFHESKIIRHSQSMEKAPAIGPNGEGKGGVPFFSYFRIQHPLPALLTKVTGKDFTTLEERYKGPAKMELLMLQYELGRNLLFLAALQQITKPPLHLSSPACPYLPSSLASLPPPLSNRLCSLQSLGE